MIRRSLALFVAGVLLGVIAAFLISLGVIGVIAAFAIVVIAGVGSRSHAALAGGLIGIGMAWLTFAVLTFGMSLNGGRGSGGWSYLPFLLSAAVIVLMGLVVAAIGIAREVARRRNVRA